MDYEKIAKQNRKKGVLDQGASSMVRVSYGRGDIQKLIPHREPFLLIDRIDAIDLEQGGIIGSRRVAPEDPVFQGHFPGYPILPGVLQIEMIGQLAICFHDFHKRHSTKIENGTRDLGVRALKIYHTIFQHEVLPGDEVEVVAKLLEEDEYKFKGIGQVINGGRVCTIAIAEFYIV
ncbi:MAG: beta-hydroxyacyl-ACP dehydratase [Candidatus Lokiarchaeota archaeon]|nr:beta-hydroxyacyl-ACP dehydratase [Candidatus Lokiarchaeota archaeon]